VPGVAKPVLTGDHGRLGRPVVLPHDIGEFPGRYRGAAADVEDPPGGAVVGQHQHIGVDDIVDVDVVPDRPAVLVENRRRALQVTQAEDAARAGVCVVDRLPRALDDAVAQGDGGNAVPAAEVDGDHLLAQLGYAVSILRVTNPLGRDTHLQRAAADRAADVPLALGQSLLGTHSRQLLAIGPAPVEAFTHRGLR